MSRTVAQIETCLSKNYLFDYVSGAASGDGNVSGTTVLTTSDDVLQKPGETWVPYILELTSGTYSGQSRQISSVAVVSGVATITVVNAFGGQVLSTVTFRVHRLPPARKIDNISAALASLQDILPYIIEEEFLAGNFVKNCNLEYWQGNVPYDWDVASGTVTKETSIVYQGRSALKLVGATGRVRQYVRLEGDLEDFGLTFSVYAYSAAADGVAKIGLTVNGAETLSTQAVANSTWQKLSVTGTPTGRLQPIILALTSGDVTNPVYFDAAELSITTDTNTFIVPITSVFRSVNQVLRRPAYTGTSGSELAFDLAIHPPDRIVNGYGRYNRRIAVDTALRLIGPGYWPTVTAATDTVDITPDEEHLVAMRAAILLMRWAKGSNYLGDQQHWTNMEADLVRREAELIKTMTKPGMGKYLPRPVR